MNSPSPLTEPHVWTKLSLIAKCANDVMEYPQQYSIPGPLEIGRDIPVLNPSDLPRKKGIGFAQGQARLLHDLASIELQATELAFRTLVEFPSAPPAFREELATILISEASHLRLCLEGLEKLGFSWGTWPVHIALWQAASSKDSLLDRILVVHRYLEGSGLDAGDTFLKRLNGLGDNSLTTIVKTIVRDEIGHVEFGSRWYRQVCKSEGLDPAEDFPARTEKLRFQVPRRMEPISTVLRKKAGFTDREIEYMEELRASMSKQPKRPGGGGGVGSEESPGDLSHLADIIN